MKPLSLCMADPLLAAVPAAATVHAPSLQLHMTQPTSLRANLSGNERASACRQAQGHAGGALPTEGALGAPHPGTPPPAEEVPRVQEDRPPPVSRALPEGALCSIPVHLLQSKTYMLLLQLYAAHLGYVCLVLCMHLRAGLRGGLLGCGAAACPLRLQIHNTGCNVCSAAA